jgi:hypothetical protein
MAGDLLRQDDVAQSNDVAVSIAAEIVPGSVGYLCTAILFVRCPDFLQAAGQDHMESPRSHMLGEVERMIPSRRQPAEQHGAGNCTSYVQPIPQVQDGVSIHHQGDGSLLVALIRRQLAISLVRAGYPGNGEHSPVPRAGVLQFRERGLVSCYLTSPIVPAVCADNPFNPILFPEQGHPAGQI